MSCTRARCTSAESLSGAANIASTLVPSAWLRRDSVATVGLLSFFSIWLIMDFATPDISDSSPSDSESAFRRREIVSPSFSDKASVLGQGGRLLALGMTGT